MKVFNHIFSCENNLINFINSQNIPNSINTILHLSYKNLDLAQLNELITIIQKNLPKIKIIVCYSSRLKNTNAVFDFNILESKDEKDIEKIQMTNMELQYEKELKKINSLLNQYKKVVDFNSIISKTDIEGKITYANDKFCKVSGYAYNELIGQSHNIVRAPEVPSHTYEELWQKLQNKQTWQGILKNRTKDGENYYVESTIMPILDEDGEILEYIALRHNITDIMNPKKQIIEKLKIMINPIFVMIKIEDYEILDDLYDQEGVETIEDNFGSKLLEFFPKELNFRKVYQLGNGEFAFLKDLIIKDVDIQEKHLLLKKFQENILNAKIMLNDYEYDINVMVSFSIGTNDIFENTKYGLKKAQKENLDVVFANDLIKQKHIQALHNIKIIKMVKQAISDKKIISYFQPIICNKTSEIKKYESLVRLIDKDNNVVSPFHFIDISKKGKYYSQITDTVLDQSFLLLDIYDTDVTINLSTLDIENKYIRSKITNLLMVNQDKASRVVFELLEDENAKNYKLVFDFIAYVKSLGAKIAIDDFGAGYSNFNRLLEFQPDILKIDGSLIKNIEHDRFSKNVVETIHEFALKQDIETVAEFVSNKSILDIVNKIGINYSQGFFIGKPEKIL